jgi:hypothetical protein
VDTERISSRRKALGAGASRRCRLWHDRPR